MLTNRFWKFGSYSFGLMAIGVLFILIGVTACIEIKDLDIWLHLGMGQFIVDNGYVPYVDVLSNSVFGKPWINHEWLFQVILHGVRVIGGMDGLILMQVVVVCVTFFILLVMTHERDRQIPVLLGLVFVLMIYQQRFTIRPDLYSIFFSVVYLSVAMYTLRYRWSIYVIFGTQILWANIHGLSFLGHFILLSFLVAEFIKRRAPLPYEWNHTDRLSDQAYGHLKLAVVLSLVGSAVSPYFIKGAWFPLYHALNPGDERQFFQYITELQRPFSWPDFFNFNVQQHYKVLIIVSVISLVLNRARLNLGLLGTWMMMFIFSQVAVRNVIYFAIFAYVFTLQNLSHRNLDELLPFRFKAEKLKYMTSWLIKIGIIIWMLNYVIGFAANKYYDFDKHAYKSELFGVTKRVHPYQMVDFLVENEITGNFWNDFNSGAYMVGRTFPDIKVYIDGRTLPYGFAHFEKYRTVWEEGDEALFDAEVKRHHLTGMLLNGHAQKVPEPLLKMMYDKEGWVPVYFDYDGIVYLKDVPVNQEWIDAFGFDFDDWTVSEADLYAYAANRVRPYHYTNRAYMLKTMGLADKALIEAEEALRIHPSNLQALELKADILADKEKTQASFEAIRLAAMYEPSNPRLRHKLAERYIELDREDDALEQIEMVLESYPQAVPTRLLLAELWLSQDRKEDAYQQALEALKTAKPSHIDLFVELGQTYQDAGEDPVAQDLWTRAHQLNEEALEPVEKLIDFYVEHDQQKQLAVMLAKGLAIDPDRSEWVKLKKKLGLK